MLDLVFRTGRVSGGKDTATISESPGTTEVDLAADVLFAFNSDRLSPAAQAELRETAKLIREHAKGPIRVEGHTDSVGSPSYNLGLSQRRAEAVRAALERLLAGRPTQFQVRGFRRQQADRAQPQSRRQRQSQGAAAQPPRHRRHQHVSTMTTAWMRSPRGPARRRAVTAAALVLAAALAAACTGNGDKQRDQPAPGVAASRSGRWPPCPATSPG